MFQRYFIREFKANGLPLLGFYKRCWSLSTSHTRPLLQLPTRTVCPMQTPAPSNSRKRRRSDQYPREAEEEAFQIASKKHKAIHTPDPSQPATQQDDPSPILLKRDTLRVLRRQYTQAARESRANPRPRRPATRLANAEWQRRHPPLKPARTYLKHCRHEQYRALQSFARHGGPDLRELRGVCISNASPFRCSC